jgi:hypothetical protein
VEQVIRGDRTHQDKDESPKQGCVGAVDRLNSNEDKDYNKY